MINKKISPDSFRLGVNMWTLEIVNHMTNERMYLESRKGNSLAEAFNSVIDDYRKSWWYKGKKHHRLLKIEGHINGGFIIHVSPRYKIWVYHARDFDAEEGHTEHFGNTDWKTVKVRNIKENLIQIKIVERELVIWKIKK